MNTIKTIYKDIPTDTIIKKEFTHRGVRMVLSRGPFPVKCGWSVYEYTTGLLIPVRAHMYEDNGRTMAGIMKSATMVLDEVFANGTDVVEFIKTKTVLNN